MQLNPDLTTHIRSLGLELNDFQLALLDSADNNLQSMLVMAPTGIGKTLGVSVLVLNDWITSHQPKKQGRRKRGSVNQHLAVWVSPLKALSRNLLSQLDHYWAPLWTAEQVPTLPTSRAVADRTGDTSQADRQNLTKEPPFILCTTPESLFSMTVQKGTRKLMQSIRYVVVDELHALAESKRGVLLSLTLEALERITPEPLVRLGVSATVANLNWMAQFLVGPQRSCTVFHEERYEKTPDLTVVARTRQNRRFLPSFGFGGGWLASVVAPEVSSDRTLLIFTTTRSAAERMAVGLRDLVGEHLRSRVGVHHSSLSVDERFFVEQGLRHGFFKAVTTTASLELGVDIGEVDEVFLVASPGSVNRALQRLGRARHTPTERPKGRIYCTNAYDFLVSIALVRQIKDRVLSPVEPIEKPLEVLAQFIFGLAIQGPFTREELEELLSNTLLFQNVGSAELDQVLTYCTQGGRSLTAYPEYQRLTLVDGLYRLNSKRFQRLFYQNLGTIIEEEMIPVVSKRGRRIGELEEGVGMKLKQGDVIALGGSSYLVEGYQKGQVVVTKSTRPPTIPRWGKTRIPMSGELLAALQQVFAELESQAGQLRDDWLDEGQSQLLLDLYTLHTALAPWPTADVVQVELYSTSTIPKRPFHLARAAASSPFLVIVYTFAGLLANHSISRLVAHRLEERHNLTQCRMHTDELAFALFASQPFPSSEEDWKLLLSPEGAVDELRRVVEDSHALRIAFRDTVVLGQMVLRTYYGDRKTARQLRLSHDLLFDVLRRHEPDHPLLQAAVQQVSTQFLHIPQALEWMTQFSRENIPLAVVEPRSPPPISLPVVVHGWVDWSVPESPVDALDKMFEEIMSSYEETYGRAREDEGG